jgi:outer membrane immunogenic protein
MYRIPKILCWMFALILIGTVANASSPNTQKTLLDSYKASLSNYNLWTGVQIGAMVSHNWNDLEYYEPGWPGYDRNPSIDGYGGGIFIGYSRQFVDMVYGVEADLGLVSLSEGTDDQAKNRWTSFDIDWTSHVRARIGKTINATLIYGAAGIAMAGVTVDDTDPGWGTDDSTHIGWTIGAGVEYAMSHELRVRLEYLYDDFGKEDYTILGPGGYAYNANVDLTANIIRIGLSFQF